MCTANMKLTLGLQIVNDIIKPKYGENRWKIMLLILGIRIDRFGLE